jgi:hypothetical protein
MAFKAQTADARARLILGVLDALPDPIFVKNSDHTVVWGNRAMATLMGTETVAVSRGDEFFPQDQMDVFYEADRKVLAGEPSLNEEQVGENMFSLTKKVPLRLPDGSAGLVGILFDISAYKENERQAREAQADAQVKSQFLANMSHEIRTPLNGVIGMAQSLLQDDLTNEQRAKIDVMMESSRALLAVVSDILDLAKTSEGKIVATPVDVDVTFLIKRTIDLSRSKAADKGLSIELSLDVDFPPRLSIDPVRTRQCLTNLLSNAIKFTETGGVFVSARRVVRDGQPLLEIEVRDTGIGLRPEEQNQLFQQFTQADGSATRKIGGAGLGLTITRRLARVMGGDVTVQSEPGRGSTFCLSMRADPPHEALPSGETAEAAPRPKAELRGKRALIVDDNALNRKVVQMFLAPYSLVVTEAVHGQAALDELAKAPFDVVLMDIHMPVMDGTEAVKRIRAADAAWSNIPVIALTADAMNGDREKYLALGMTDYLPKPIDQRALLAILAKVFQARADDARRTAA